MRPRLKWERTRIAEVVSAVGSSLRAGNALAVSSGMAAGVRSGVRSSGSGRAPGVVVRVRPEAVKRCIRSGGCSVSLALAPGEGGREPPRVRETGSMGRADSMLDVGGRGRRGRRGKERGATLTKWTMWMMPCSIKPLAARRRLLGQCSHASVRSMQPDSSASLGQLSDIHALAGREARMESSKAFTSLLHATSHYQNNIHPSLSLPLIIRIPLPLHLPRHFILRRLVLRKLNRHL